MSEPIRAALEELVACKDLKDEIEKMDGQFVGTVDEIDLRNRRYEYGRRKPLAWKVARDVLAAPLQQEADKDCDWVQDSDGCWNSACGQCFEFNEGSPRENNANFCHFCGGKMVEHGFTEEPFDDEDAALPSDEKGKL